jgi:hypothetical protein
MSSDRIRTKSRITRINSRDDASSARDKDVRRLHLMFCVTSIMRAMKDKEREECKTKKISSDKRRSMPVYERDNERVRDNDDERYEIRAASIKTIR